MLIPVRLALMTATLLAVFLLALVAVPSAALAHGNLDQSLEGDPGCNTTNFAASVTASTGQRQSFVPTGGQLASVALCVSATATTPLVVAIYDAGGTLIGGGSTANNPSIPDAAGPPVRYVHVDFVQPYTVTPGATYIIENVSGSIPITWYGTTASSPYTYCLGAPNTSAVIDYGFQSFLADAPGASAACPQPTPTNTPPPIPTNTPLPPTNTPVPGDPAAPTITAVPGEPVVAEVTPASTDTAPSVTGSTAGDTTAPVGNTPPSSTQAGSALPRTGDGPGAAPSAPRTAFFLFALGVAIACAGARQSTIAHKNGRR